MRSGRRSPEPETDAGFRSPRGGLPLIPAAATIALAFGPVHGCANEAPPPGMLPDARPPQVLEIEPAADSVVPGFEDDIRIKFDEPIRVGRNIGTELQVSPAGRYEVQTGFSDIRIRPREGWLDSVVYCLALPEGIADLNNNRTAAPLEFCFSTGPPLTSTTVLGEVTDGTTGRSITEGRVLFLALPEDSTPYSAVTDREGQFQLKALPPRRYWAFGFLDRNGNFALDRTLEPYDSASFALPGETSTATLSLALLEPDSTPPLLVVAEAVDSLTVRLEFDDFLLREQAEPSVSLADTASGRAWEVASVHVGEPSEVPRRQEETVPEEEAAAEPATADTARGEPADTSAGPPAAGEAAARTDLQGEPRRAEAPAGEDQERASDAPALPSRVVTVLLAETLRAAGYRVFADGFTNVRGLTGGGDTTFVYEPPAEDTTAAPPPAEDTARVPAPVEDTVAVPPPAEDTVAVPPPAEDTVAVPPPAEDTARAGPPSGGRGPHGVRPFRRRLR